MYSPSRTASPSATNSLSIDDRLAVSPMSFASALVDNVGRCSYGFAISTSTNRGPLHVGCGMWTRTCPRRRLPQHPVRHGGDSDVMCPCLSHGGGPADVPEIALVDVRVDEVSTPAASVPETVPAKRAPRRPSGGQAEVTGTDLRDRTAGGRAAVPAGDQGPGPKVRHRQGADPSATSWPRSWRRSPRPPDNRHEKVLGLLVGVFSFSGDNSSMAARQWLLVNSSSSIAARQCFRRSD